MVLLSLAVLAGALTVLSPCAVTLLPAVVAPSLVPEGGRPARWTMPVVISVSLGVSVVVSTLVLKWLTTFAAVDPRVWRSVSGGIVIALGLFMLRPTWWDRVAARSGLVEAAHTGLVRARRGKGYLRWVLTGAALGPVFSSCSPVYAFVLASVLPVDVGTGVALVVGYGVGLTFALLLVSVAGRALITRLGWAVNPAGWFRRTVAVALVLTGVIVVAGWQRRLEDGAGRVLPTALSALENRVLDSALESGGAGAGSGTEPRAAGAAGEGAQAPARPRARMSEAPYPAPEFAGLSDPLNVATSPTLANLRGKVVLVDFWTFGCYNCRNTQSHLNAWHDRYVAQGLRIVGVHAPEFSYERVPANVAAAVTEAGIGYAVALDNTFTTWRAYGVHAWPTMVFVDKSGRVRHIHVGEGDYDNSAAVIEALLAE
jgi:cytochrome c biogenesis protein CcdA/thiol-disulfide isomerase/thioredoxin